MLPLPSMSVVSIEDTRRPIDQPERLRRRLKKLGILISLAELRRMSPEYFDRAWSWSGITLARKDVLERAMDGASLRGEKLTGD